MILSAPCIKQITTRDNLSGITSQNSMVIPDVAILAYRYYGFPMVNKDRKEIGINILHPSYYINSPDNISFKQFNEKMIEIVTQLSKIHKTTIFTNGNILDYRYANWLYNKIYKLGNITIDTRPTNGLDLVKIINKFSLVIGFRLHSLITAYSYNIPTIGILWDNKLSYWGQMTDNKNIYLLSEFPIPFIESICNETMRNGINQSKKKTLERQIMEQIKTYTIN
jgi:polysaccharide pyruvyl transferase WcaK-like protein